MPRRGQAAERLDPSYWTLIRFYRGTDRDRALAAEARERSLREAIGTELVQERGRAERILRRACEKATDPPPRI